MLTYSRLPQLPLEVWHICLDLCADDSPSLLASSLVCRSWSFHARKYLFREIKLYILHSLERTHSFFQLLTPTSPPNAKTSFTSTFSYATRAVSLHEFDYPYHTASSSSSGPNPRKFLRHSLQQLSTLNHLENLTIQNLGWDSSAHTPSIAFLFPHLRKLVLRHCKVGSQTAFIQLIGRLTQLEVLDVYIGFHKSKRTGNNSSPSPLPPVPTTLTSLSIQCRSSSTDFSLIYNWIATSSSPTNISSLKVPFCRNSLASLRTLLVSLRSTLKVLCLGPMFKISTPKHGEESSMVVTEEDLLSFEQGSFRPSFQKILIPYIEY